MIGMKLWIGLGVLVVGLATGQDEPFVCPPCGADCHADEYERAGNCSGCGMELVPRSRVPQVAVLLFPGTDVMSFSGPAGVLAGSNGMNVFTVADTTDPLRCQDFLEVIPQYSFEDVPPIDVLIVPPVGPNELEDEYFMGWLAQAAKEADHVLTVGTGTLAAATTGLLDGEEVAAADWALRLGPEYAPDVTFSADKRLCNAGKFVTARDNAAAIEAAFNVLALIESDEIASATAERLGFTWPREAK